MEAGVNHSPKAKPWSRMWFRPAKAFSVLVEMRNTNYMHRLMVVWSVSATAVVMIPFWRDPHSELHPMEPLIQLLVMAPFLGLIAGYVFGAALKGTGSWMGGTGGNDVLRMVFAWSLLPVILAHAGCIVFYLASEPTTALFNPVILAILSAGTLWGIIIRHAGIKTALQLRDGKAILTQLLSSLIVLVPLILVALVYYAVLKGAFKIA